LEASCLSRFGDSANHYIISDFVGIVKIQAVFDSPSKETNYYKIKIKPLTTFKGKAPSTLKVIGEKDVISIPNTDVDVGEEWLVYAFDDKDGNYYFGSCSSPMPRFLKGSDDSKRKNSERLQKELDQLKLFKKEVSNLDRNYSIYIEGFSLFDYLKKYNGQIFDQSFAIYLITFDKDLGVKNIEVLRGLSSEFDKRFTTVLKNKASWRTSIEPGRPKIEINTENTRHIIGVYYFPEKKKLFPMIYTGYD